MKKLFTLLTVLCFGYNLFAQSLYISQRDYSNSSSLYSLEEINQNTGALSNSHTYTSTIPGSYSPQSLTYNSTTNEIFGIAENIVVKYNPTTKAESMITLPTLTSQQDYRDIVIANNRLFVTMRDYSNSSSIYYLEEINQNTGALISSHTFTSAIPGSYSPESLTYNSSSNEIFGIVENLVVKYNISSQIESSITLPTVTSTQDYGDIIIANNRLFVTKRDYTNSSSLFYINEINQSTGVLINSHTFTTNIPSSYSPASLVYNPTSNEILGIAQNEIYSGGILSSLEYFVIKYNISTQSEGTISLPTATSHDYGELVLATNSTSGIYNTKISSNEISTPINAFNLQGQNIPLNTVSDIMIVKYKDGSARKLMQIR